MMRSHKLLLAAWAASLCGYSASAQEAKLLEAGASVTSQSLADEPDIYKLMGVPGLQLTATVDAVGETVLTLLTSEGEEMMSSSGSGTVQLAAVLPQYGLFYISVTRPEGGAAYKLAIKEEVPDPFESHLAYGIGYSYPDRHQGYRPHVRCWVVPGSRARWIFDNGIRYTYTLGRDGNMHLLAEGDGKTYNFNHAMQVDGDRIRWVKTEEDGLLEPSEANFRWLPSYSADQEIGEPSVKLKWHSYYCP